MNFILSADETEKMDVCTGEEGKVIHLTIRQLTGDRHELDISSNATVKQLLIEIGEKLRTTPYDFWRLVFAGKEITSFKKPFYTSSFDSLAWTL